MSTTNVNGHKPHIDPAPGKPEAPLPPVILKDERVVMPMSAFRAHSGMDDAQGELALGACTRLRDGIVRWLPNGVSPDRLMPSFSLDDPSLAHEAGSPTDCAVHAHFGHTLDGRHLVEVPVDAGTTMHGVGMAAAGVDRSGRRYTCWNTDWPAYDDE
ncbi:MAG: hypothetical protein AAGH64_07465, partial [Planctomycetota bacterium]